VPGADITRLSGVELVEAARGASDDSVRRHVEAEMWRRTTQAAEHANLLETERTLSMETVGLWAIEVAILAMLIALFVVPNSLVDPGGFDVGIVVCAVALLANTVALLAAMTGRARARRKLRTFDAEQQASG
jgi:hypothetical protein